MLLHPEPIHHSGGKIIPMIRRAMIGSFRNEKPRLLEPYYICDIRCPINMKDKVDLLLVNKEFNILEEVIEENITDNQYFIRISISASQTLDFPINISNTPNLKSLIISILSNVSISE